MLGPLIFLLNGNDFPEKLEGEIDVVQFADDTNIICKFERNENIPQKLKKIRTNRQIPDRESTHSKCDKTEMLFFTNHTNSDPEFPFKGLLSNQLMHVVIWDYKLIQT